MLSVPQPVLTCVGLTLPVFRFAVCVCPLSHPGTSSMRAVSLVAFAAGISATILTDANFDERTAGKTVFIKFQAPW